VQVELRGIPTWLLDLREGGKKITFRTDDPLWVDLMLKFIDKTIDVLNAEGLFANKGGPIIMMQIENEYGNVEGDFGDAGVR